jgi:hypothetical protein
MSTHALLRAEATIVRCARNFESSRATKDRNDFPVSLRVVGEMFSVDLIVILPFGCT